MKKVVCLTVLGLGLLGCSSEGDDPSGAGGAAGGAGLPTPVIPQTSETCPEFVTGPQEIMGLQTQIVAGTPGASKGPLLFTFHGTNGNGAGAVRQLPQSVQDDIVGQGGIIIAPTDNREVREGQDVTVILGVWYDVADLRYADHLVSCAVKNHNIDPRRIYVTGCSAGGLMAGVMSLARSSYVAAAAPNSGGVVQSVPLEDPNHVPALMTMHGGTGDTVVVNFGDTSHNLQNIILPAGGFTVECNHGLGHCRAPAELHERAWDFMKAHPFGTRPSPYEAGLPGDFPSYCAIQ
jgi:predicted esterase